MNDQRYLNKRKTIFITVFTLVAFIFFITLGDFSDINVDDTSKHYEHNHTSNKESLNKPYDLKSKENTLNNKSGANESDSPFPNYKYKADEVYSWIQEYPKSKAKLIEVATSEDPYLKMGLKIKSHSSHEIQQEKFGALRVMALQALYDEEKDSKEKYNNLVEVSKKAKDPVIKRISLSMIESLKKGRNYEDDFLKAAGQ